MSRPLGIPIVPQLLLCCALVAALAGCGKGEPTTAATVTPTVSKAVHVDPGELERFADGFFPEQMEELRIPGLVVVVVQDGEVVFAKGYGYTNLEAGTPFDPHETVVRIGSISKLFVATAVMQLVEEGELDLHADVNTYLSGSAFQVDDTFPEPVTLAHLLTHTSGYGESADSSEDPATIPPLETYLMRHMPPRLEPPGEKWNYSGHGNAVAALVVEQVSGVPFDQHVSENILRPLGMEHSRYLLAPPLPENIAIGYVYDGDDYVPQAIEYYGDYPGAMLVSTPADMARFMIAHLQNGCYAGACILEPAILEQMQQSQPDLSCNGCTLGFVGGVKNGQRLIGHAGAVHGFGNILELLPDHDLGYFFSFNAECWNTSACDVIPGFRQAFLDWVFP